MRPRLPAACRKLWTSAIIARASKKDRHTMRRSSRRDRGRSAGGSGRCQDHEHLCMQLGSSRGNNRTTAFRATTSPIRDDASGLLDDWSESHYVIGLETSCIRRIALSSRSSWFSNHSPILCSERLAKKVLNNPRGQLSRGATTRGYDDQRSLTTS